jgi:hypothetical protein
MPPRAREFEGKREMLKQLPDLAEMRWTEMPGYASVIPWRAEIPKDAMSASDAVALAQKSGIDADCRGAAGCALINRAELHMYIVGKGETLPVWRIAFGRDEEAHEVVRLIDARTGKLITNCGVPAASAAATSRGNLYLMCR